VPRQKTTALERSASRARNSNNRSQALTERIQKFQATTLQQVPSDEKRQPQVDVSIESEDTKFTPPTPRRQTGGDGSQQSDLSSSVGQRVRQMQQQHHYGRATQTLPSTPPRGNVSSRTLREFQGNRTGRQRQQQQLDPLPPAESTRLLGQAPSPRERHHQETIATAAVAASQSKAQGQQRRLLEPDGNRQPVLGDNARLVEETGGVSTFAQHHKFPANGEATSIESPSPTNVRDIKKQLWDKEESLQVQVRPSLQAYGEPEKFNKHWLHYHGPEMAGRNGERTRSRSMSPDRKPYRRPTSSDNANGPAAPTANNSAPPFKSKFYQAAIAAQRGRTLSPSAQGQAAIQQPPKARSQPSSPARPSWRSPRDGAPTAQHQFDQAQSSSASGSATENTVAKLVAKLNSIDRNDPAAALAKIDSILKSESISEVAGELREEPPLEPRIKMTPAAVPSPPPKLVDDAVLRRSFSGSQGQQQKYNEEEEEEETTECDSDDETSVSSITNPTYISQKHSKDAQEVSDPNKSTATCRRPRPSKLGSYAGGQGDRPISPPVHEERRGKSSKSRKVRSPPPPTIKVSKSSTKSADNEQAENSSVYAIVQSASKEKKLDTFMSKDAPTDMTGENAAAIALKIQKWDEMSNDPSQPSRSQGVVDVSFETEELGSIVTPCQGTPGEWKDERESETPSPPRRTHPWDAYKSRGDALTKEPRNTSMSSGCGVEVPIASPQPPTHHAPSKAGRLQRAREQAVQEESDSIFFGDAFDIDPKLLNEDCPTAAVKARRSPPQPKTTKELSDDYDSAWVALPPTSFFDAERSSITRPSSSKSQRRSPSPSFFDSKPALPADVAAAFSTSIDLNGSAPPISSAVAQPQQEIPPPTSKAKKSRRGFLKPLLKRNKKNGPKEDAPPRPESFSYAASSSQRNKDKPLLSAYAMDSLTDDEGTPGRSSRNRFSRSLSPGPRRSKSPFHRRRAPSLLSEADRDDTADESSSIESARSRNSHLFSRFMK
jgi:hypothetical protein